MSDHEHTDGDRATVTVSPKRRRILLSHVVREDDMRIVTIYLNPFQHSGGVTTRSPPPLSNYSNIHPSNQQPFPNPSNQTHQRPQKLQPSPKRRPSRPPPSPKPAQRHQLDSQPTPKEPSQRQSPTHPHPHYIQEHPDLNSTWQHPQPSAQSVTSHPRVIDSSTSLPPSLQPKSIVSRWKPRRRCSQQNERASEGILGPPYLLLVDDSQCSLVSGSLLGYAGLVFCFGVPTCVSCARAWTWGGGKYFQR